MVRVKKQLGKEHWKYEKCNKNSRSNQEISEKQGKLETGKENTKSITNTRNSGRTRNSRKIQEM